MTFYLTCALADINTIPDSREWWKWVNAILAQDIDNFSAKLEQQA